jgi:hypothetical protein
MSKASSLSESREPLPWWIVSLLSAIAAMVVAFGLLFVPIRWLWLPGIGLVVFLLMLRRNPAAWYRRMAGAAFGAAIITTGTPSISGVISIDAGSFAAFVMDSGAGIQGFLFVTAVVFGCLDFLSRRPERTVSDLSRNVDQHQTAVDGNVTADKVEFHQHSHGSPSEQPTAAVDESDSPAQELESATRETVDSSGSETAIEKRTWKEMPFPVSKLPRTGEHLVGRTKEKASLTRAWNNPKTCIVQIVAPGGVGKTQLVKKWRESLLDRAGHGGAVRVYDWSFYSQGTQQQASADDFFAKALEWFGETDLEKYKDPWSKGERLAELVRQQRTLLILDGMEPLQHPPGPMAGELTDPSIKALLQGLSVARHSVSNHETESRATLGLCIVTTREAVPTLDEMSEPKRVTVDLDSLSPQAGAELLGHYGVTGEPDELRQASVDVDGHALALILLGTYLKSRCRGDVRRRSEALLFKGHERYAAHAHKVMASYEAWFEQQDDTSRAAVAILRLMGLFNRPADAGCLAALRAEPRIPGLTEALFVGDRDDLWQRAIERLRAARLLADDSSALDSGPSALDSLDAHPLRREHFAEQLASGGRQPTDGTAGLGNAKESAGLRPPLAADLQDAAREAHRRLYEHLKQSAPELPDNLNDMMPLYHAVAHGCKAGLWDDSFQVIAQRIWRGNEVYSLHKLGAFGVDLAALSGFFDQMWNKTVSELNEDNRLSVINVAGFNLRAVGRLRESAGPIESPLYGYVKRSDWRNAAIKASNLSELSLTLGDVSSAVRQGEQSVELADRGGDAFMRMATRTTLAAALHAAGGKRGSRGAGEAGETRRQGSLLVSPSQPSARPRRCNRRGSRSIPCSTRRQATGTAICCWI